MNKEKLTVNLTGKKSQSSHQYLELCYKNNLFAIKYCTFKMHLVQVFWMLKSMEHMPVGPLILTVSLLKKEISTGAKDPQTIQVYSR